MKAIRKMRPLLIVGGVVALTAAGSGVSFASTRSSACNVPARYPTILSAVDDTGCKTVQVAPGAYTESVTVSRSLTLQGAQAGQDARSRRAGRESVVNGFTVKADNVTVDGFTVNGPADQGSAGLVMQGANSGETIQNNIFNNPGRAASFTTSRTVFRRNAVKNTATAGDGFQGNSTAVHDVTIADNNFSGADPSKYNADVTFIEGDKNLTVSGNRSTGDGTLVALFKTTGAKITGNTVTGSKSSSAIYIGGTDHAVTVSDNTISDAGTAVKVANDFGGTPNSAVTITRNTLRRNQYGVNVAKGGTSDPVRANRNTITGNALYGVFNDPAAGADTDATCNWWGDVRGPGHGDKVSANVTYKPWLKLSSLFLGCH
ncbi:nitrous oxide reductase family maturation protein NosD [Actinoplanes sp. NPDC051343]|uniref:nitrous oxide reductase family maturation protein NosD n=1 Tax=Actinoplanes sp. NPDC051343 TaxID=3363906 RepID=UPI0037A3214E